MEKIIVQIGDGKTAVDGQILVSYALGSCVGVCLYDRRKKIAGMVHIVLPASSAGVSEAAPYKYADKGIRALICDMQARGAVKRQLVAKIAGGARMFAAISDVWEIGSKNIEAVKRILQEEGIPIIAEDIGKNYGRTVSFSAEDGRMSVSTVKGAVLVL